MVISKDLLQLFCKILVLDTIGTKAILQNRICAKLNTKLNITKDTLQLICKSLQANTVGTKAILIENIRTKLCGAIMSSSSTSSSKTLKSIITDQDKVYTILQDIIDMSDDDASYESIIKTISKTHNIKVSKKDVVIFLELVSSLKKKDYDFITEKNISKNDMLLLKIYAKYSKTEFIF
jgi:hypothetical protein